MHLKIDEYNKISDLFLLRYGEPFLKGAILEKYKTPETLIKQVAKILDNVRARHWEQNKKTAEYISRKRKQNKNYARQGEK